MKYILDEKELKDLQEKEPKVTGELKKIFIELFFKATDTQCVHDNPEMEYCDDCPFSGHGRFFEYQHSDGLAKRLNSLNFKSEQWASIECDKSQHFSK